MPDKSTAPEIVRLTAEKRPAVRNAVLFVVALCLLLLTIQVSDGWRARKERLADVAVATTNMSHALAAQAESAVRVVDTVLAGVVERVETDGADGAARPRLQLHLKNMVTEVDELHGLFVFGADGRWLMTSQDRIPLYHVDDREYFQYHRNNPDRYVHIGKPVRSRSTGDWVLPISRRLNNPDGTFGGVALGTIRIAYFSTLYKTFDVGRAGVIMLTLDDGTMIYRLPHNEKLIGSDVSNGPVHQMYQRTGPTGTDMLRSKIDGIERLYSYRHLETYPLIVATAQSKQEILEKWLKSMLGQAAITIVAILLLLYFGRRLVRQIVIRDHLEHELLQARAMLQEHNRALTVLADNDSLTGIANRRRFEEALGQEYARAARSGAPLSLLMFDVDYFKRYNDTYGHVAGDACLRQVAQTLQDSLVRPADMAARYGGEEFVALLPDTDPAGARMVAERIRQAVMALAIPHAGNGAGVVTISVGVYTGSASAGMAADSATALVERADALLYQAKQSGRNQVCGGDLAAP
ncbi:sensor domain-containing diguanylate cyclase [Massilia sp. HP4]|uniref:sensor domain-containing diguanylate cyclase n=1 Tax=Massilia sp. HP4 TaxID=2562316 RepID=UPI0010C0CC3F|nr:sensor domain-containing diguanylate cyclase [Massilia sp. HP4]